MLFTSRKSNKVLITGRKFRTFRSENSQKITILDTRSRNNSIEHRIFSPPPIRESSKSYSIQEWKADIGYLTFFYAFHRFTPSFARISATSRDVVVCRDPLDFLPITSPFLREVAYHPKRKQRHHGISDFLPIPPDSSLSEDPRKSVYLLYAQSTLFPTALLKYLIFFTPPPWSIVRAHFVLESSLLAWMFSHFHLRERATGCDKIIPLFLSGLRHRVSQRLGKRDRACCFFFFFLFKPASKPGKRNLLPRELARQSCGRRLRTWHTSSATLALLLLLP